MAEVVLLDEREQEKTIRQEDAWLYKKNIREGDLVLFHDGRLIHAAE